ncbi:MAG: hypothetical protein B7Y15_14835, partial [Bacteroidetes bacterium 24-39-8]
MEDKFEHQIADQVSGFQLTPSNHVWKGVELELDKDKNRKRPFIWWIPIGLLGISLAGIYFFHSSPLSKTPANLQPINNTKKELPIASFQKADSTIENTAKIIKEETVRNTIRNSFKTKPTNQNIQIETSSTKMPITPKNAVQEPLAKKDAHLDQASKETLLNNLPTKPKDNIVDSALEKGIANIPVWNSQTTKDQENKIDSGNAAKQITTSLNKKQSIGNWRIQVAIGRTYFSQNSLLGNTVAADRNAFINNGSAVVSGIPSSNTLALAAKGFHAELGISRVWKWSKRWEFEAGLSYRYLQNQQTTGIKKDSTYNINSQATTNNQALNLNSYYLAGNEFSLVNRAHWLMFPMQIHFNLNPSSKINWLVYGGANLSWNFSSNWLLTDQVNHLFYESRSLTNILGLHFQTGIQIRNPKQQSLSLGWEKSINSLSKLNQSKQYWNQLQLKYSQP